MLLTFSHSFSIHPFIKPMAKILQNITAKIFPMAIGFIHSSTLPSSFLADLSKNGFYPPSPSTPQIFSFGQQFAPSSHREDRGEAMEWAMGQLKSCALSFKKSHQSSSLMPFHRMAKIERVLQTHSS
jgi:hypothetical protein